MYSPSPTRKMSTVKIGSFESLAPVEYCNLLCDNDKRYEIDDEIKKMLNPYCNMRNNFDIRNLEILGDLERAEINEFCDYFPEVCDILNTAGESLLTYTCGEPSPYRKFCTQCDRNGTKVPIDRTPDEGRVKVPYRLMN